MAKQIQDTDDTKMREDLERELDELVTRMEAKGEQIARLKRHKIQVCAIEMARFGHLMPLKPPLSCCFKEIHPLLNETLIFLLTLHLEISKVVYKKNSVMQ